MEINDEYIINEFFKKRLKLNKKSFIDEVKKYLKNRFKEFNSYKETVYRIKYNIEEIPKCPVCGKNCKFNGHPGLVYLTYCSNNCKKKSNLVGIHIAETRLKKYGKGIPGIITKMKMTWQNKYGTENPFQLKEIKNKKENTCLKKYGVKCVLSSKEIQKKSEETRLRKYGYANFFCDEDIRKKAQISLSSEKCKEKTKQTNLIKYGYEYYNQCPKARENLRIKLSDPEVQNKIIQTKIKNGSYKRSKKEDKCFELLKLKYKDVIRQYNSNRYPFNCDFYIPSEDLFIEFNGYWTHGGHIYNPESEEDNNIVNKWKYKYKNENKILYKNAIQIWTERDPYKRKVAKINNLNYIEFFNLDEVKYFINHDNK